MTPVRRAKKISKFDPQTFLSTLDGDRKIAAFPKKTDDFRSRTRPMLFFIYSKER